MYKETVNEYVCHFQKSWSLTLHMSPLFFTCSVPEWQFIKYQTGHPVYILVYQYYVLSSTPSSLVPPFSSPKTRSVLSEVTSTR